MILICDMHNKSPVEVETHYSRALNYNKIPLSL